MGGPFRVRLKVEEGGGGKIGREYATKNSS